MPFAARPTYSFAIFFIGILLFIPLSHAKSQVGRFGFGVSHIGPNLTPQISIALKSSESTILQAHTGFSNQSDNSRFDLGIRYARNLFIEDNQDFYFYFDGSLISQTESSTSASGYSLEAGAGSEIFFSGLPNFGLNFCSGFALVSANGTRIETRVAFGMHYYF